MSQWSKPFQEITIETKDGKNLLIINTFVNLLESELFQPALPEARILQRLLVNIEAVPLK